MHTVESLKFVGPMFVDCGFLLIRYDVISWMLRPSHTKKLQPKEIS